jgi:drug/metabolite transporter (DMT)-like permease
MTRLRLALLVALSMLAFAGNSLLCRMALKNTSIDAATFTSVRMLSGACMLWLVLRLQSGAGWAGLLGRGGAATGTDSGSAAASDTASATGTAGTAPAGNWLSACALFAYAACFSFAYVSMSAATGALLLFGSVQASMMGYGIVQGERLSKPQMLGFACALAGLVVLMLPGLVAPSLVSALLMVSAGLAWSVYTLQGKRAQSRSAASPSQVTAGNFLRTVPLALLLNLLLWRSAAWDATGLTLAAVSGALASGLGYALWYQALPALTATQAATAQLSVPVIAALGGVLLLGESLTLTMLLASAAILGGIALLILDKR